MPSPRPEVTRRRLHLVCALAGVALVCVLRAQAAPAQARRTMSSVAVFPVENLSGGTVPGDQVREHLISTLAANGVAVVGTARLDAFMTQHRVRYAAGIDAQTAEALRKETGAEGVVIPSIEFSNETAPPKIALMARLVTTSTEPTVVWADDAGLAGDDAPGLFELGMVNDYQALLGTALDRVSDSLVRYVTTGEAGTEIKARRKFRPRNAFRELTLDPARTYTVAVVPFMNLSDRRNAGEVLTLLFMRHLAGFPQLRVVDAGVVRQQLLEARIIMDGGPSLRDAETVAALIGADFVAGGRVTRYQDYEGAGGRTRVEFSTLLIERNTRKVVWSSDSYNDGMDGVRFFERGITRTAHAMATQMVRLTAEMIVTGQR